MSSDVTDLINEILNKNFKHIDNERNLLFSSIVKQNVFNLPYYNGFYKDSIISIEGDDIKVEFLNDEISVANNDKNSHFNHHVSKISSLYVKNEDVEHYNTLFSILILSENIEEYLTTIKKTSEENKNFKYFLEKNLNHLNNAKFNIFIDSLTFKELILDSDRSSLKMLKANDNLREAKNDRFNASKLKNLSIFLPLRKQIFSLDILNSEFKNEIENFMDLLKKERPFLFEKPTLENISFEFFEIQDYIAEKDYFVSSEETAFKSEILEIFGIKRSEIPLSENTQINNRFYEHFSNNPNELHQSFEHDLYGIKYLSYNDFHRNNDRACFLVAKKNNEIVSVISFKSLNYLDSFHESISSSVKHNYRGLGLSRIMYEKLAQVFNELEMTFINNHYSDLGASRIKKNKEKLNQKYENMFFIDSCMSSFSNTKHGEELYLFTKKFLTNIEDLSVKEDKNISASIIKKMYSKYSNKIVQEIEDKRKIDYDQIFLTMRKEILHKDRPAKRRKNTI